MTDEQLEGFDTVFTGDRLCGRTLAVHDAGFDGSSIRITAAEHHHGCHSAVVHQRRIGGSDLAPDFYEVPAPAVLSREAIPRDEARRAGRVLPAAVLLGDDPAHDLHGHGGAFGDDFDAQPLGGEAGHYPRHRLAHLDEMAVRVRHPKHPLAPGLLAQRVDDGYLRLRQPPPLSRSCGFDLCLQGQYRTGAGSLRRALGGIGMVSLYFGRGTMRPVRAQ